MVIRSYRIAMNSLALTSQRISLFTLSFSSFFILAEPVSATEDTLGPITRPSILPPINAGTFISGLISIIIIVAFIASFLYLLWGGFQWITSGGDEAGVSAARGRIAAALIGLTIVVAAWAFFQLVQSAFRITVLGGDLNALFREIFAQ